MPSASVLDRVAERHQNACNAKDMKVLDDLTKAKPNRDTVLTIGVFDGVHTGHQTLIKDLVARARASDCAAGLITFHPHPAAVLAPDRAPQMITTPSEKMALLEDLGIDLAILLRFDKRLASLSARDFVEMLVNHLRLRELWIGPDFALGRGREGDASRLRELGRELGYEVRVIEPVRGEGLTVSSSRIRAFLQEGDVEAATQLLARYPSVSGMVVGGAGRGRKLGFTTANLTVTPERCLPADGVYAVFVVLGAERLLGVANVGVRPSFDNGERNVEVHIFDFDRDIYGCDLVIEFVSRLRAERRFERVYDLIAQVEHDSLRARRILESMATADQGPVLRLEPCRFRFREVEHTADRALWVHGEAVADLVSGATRGMYSLMADLDGLVATEWREIQLQSLDQASLLVDWLNELLFLTDSEGLVFLQGQVESLDETTLVARAGGLVAPLTRAHIKAATYHNLELVQDDAGWSTVITFDV